MLSKNRHQHYLEFQQILQDLQTSATQGNLDRAALLAAFGEVQQFFAGQIMASDSDGLDPPPLSPLEQSCLTEMHKQLRLLGMDVAFLQASRVEATAKTRQAAASDRINTLIGYCDAMLQKDAE
ncbi:MAG TPA: heterocyst frequency control protein PatD [Kamptonema sp.]|nr:heterocyst frequency control protein PatD [Kamptonema sp.]